MTEVMIVGGGPTGMMLAGELRLHGIEVTVIEKDAEPSPLVRSLGLQPRSVELVDQRGLLDRFLAAGTPYPEGVRNFAGIPASAGVDTEGAYLLGIPQSITDRLLAEHAGERGAVVRRGAEVVGLDPDADGVSVVLADGERLRAGWVVGCDGGRSMVRRLLDIGFPGEAAQTEWLLGEVAVTTPADEIAAISDEVRRTHRGFGIGPSRSGGYRAVVPAASVAEDRATPPTLDEFRTQLRAYAGTDFGAHAPRWLSRFTDATRLADTYRRGRVFLAGDAAHVHPPLGGQGLNLGMQDAVNLGWKLAAAVAGWAPAGLLGTYESERRPVAAGVLSLTRAQSVLIAPEPGPQAVRRLLTELMAFDDVGSYLIGRVTGLGIRYDLGAADPRVGMRQRDLPLTEGRLYDRMHAGRGLLLDAGGAMSLQGWEDRVDRVDDPAGGPEAVLVRPDGYVAWVGTDPDDPREHLTQWFGAPST